MTARPTPRAASSTVSPLPIAAARRHVSDLPSRLAGQEPRDGGRRRLRDRRLAPLHRCGCSLRPRRPQALDGLRPPPWARPLRRLPPPRGTRLPRAAFVTTFAVFANLELPGLGPGAPGHLGLRGHGAFNLVRRSAYDAVGGHAKLAFEVVDDIKLGLVLRRSGVPQGACDSGGLVKVRWQEGFWRPSEVSSRTASRARSGVSPPRPSPSSRSRCSRRGRSRPCSCSSPGPCASSVSWARSRRR